MNKGTVWALAGLMILSAAVHGKEAKSRKHTTPIRPPTKLAFAEGNIVGAEYDEASGKIRITILTDSWCNSFSAKLVATVANRASFGPFHYNLVLGARTQMGCIPNIEKEKVVTVDAPNLFVKNEARIVIHGEDKTYASVTIEKDALDAGNEGDYDNSVAGSGSRRVFDGEGNLTSDSKVDGMPITSVDPGTAEALELEATGTK